MISAHLHQTGLGHVLIDQRIGQTKQLIANKMRVFGLTYLPVCHIMTTSRIFTAGEDSQLSQGLLEHSLRAAAIGTKRRSLRQKSEMTKLTLRHSIFSGTNWINLSYFVGYDDVNFDCYFLLRFSDCFMKTRFAIDGIDGIDKNLR
jgi:hypothetical protein